MIAVLLSLLFLQSRADYFDFTYLSNPIVGWSMHDGSPAPNLSAICKEMKFDYLQEKAKLAQSQRELLLALQQPIDDSMAVRIEEIKKQIFKSTSRLSFLAKPEWNAEVLDFYFIWNLWNRKAEPYHHVLGNTLREITNRYKGEYDPKLVNELGVGFAKDLYGPETWDYFKYKTTGTFLQACQFLPTLEFEIQVDIEYPDLQLRAPQKYFLKGKKP